MIDWLSGAPMCSYFGKPWLTGLHLIGNLMVFLAYMAIPVAIAIVMRVRGLPFNGLAAMFALFIFLCGFGHALSLLSMWTTAALWDWVETANDLLTGLVSIGTAIYAFRLIPTLTRIPTPSEYHEMEATLQGYRDLIAFRGRPRLSHREGNHQCKVMR